MENLQIRESLPGDLAAIETLYPDAFPDEDLLPVVKALLAETSTVLSLVATLDDAVVGHVAFTTCGVDGSDAKVAMLAPLAVASARHKQGIGSAIVRAGLQRLKDAGVVQVLVLGDPAYYGRFGFAAEADITPPYPLPAEWDGAWQSMTLGDAGPAGPGALLVPPMWDHQALWVD